MAMDGVELDLRFTHHPPPDEDTIQRYQHIRLLARSFAEQIVGFTPESREQSLAITALEEAVMWANAAIARREG